MSKGGRLQPFGAGRVFGERVIDREQNAVDAHRIAECLARARPAAAAQSLLATFLGKSKRGPMSDEIIPPHQGVYVRLRPSKLHGVGVFAICEIPPGTNLFPRDPGGLRELDPKFLENEDPEIRQLYDDYCLLSDGKWYGPSDFNNLTVGWYLNHSSDPNVACDSEFNFTTLRHIHKHEELTVDYRTYSERGRELES